MEERATGIVLRTRPLTETSLIVQWLTPELGRVSTVAKGARRPKSSFLGKLDLYYEAEFIFQRARRSTLHTLREVSLGQTRPFLRTELAALEQAARAGRWIERATEEETPLPGIYLLFRGFLDQLARPPLNAELSIAFEIKLLEELGLKPALETSPLKPGSRRILEQLLELDWDASRHLKVSSVQASEISTFLERCFQQGMA